MVVLERRAPIRSERQRWLAELGELISFPTVSALPGHRPALERAAVWLRDHLAGIGLHDAQILAAAGDGAPSVYAQWLVAPGRPVLLLEGLGAAMPSEARR